MKSKVELLQECDAVVYDSEDAEELLDYVRPNCKRVYVGKQSGCHLLPQNKIDQILIGLVKEGKRVVRLMGGESFDVGREEEEMRSLKKAGIEVQEVVWLSRNDIGKQELSGVKELESEEYTYAVHHIKDYDVVVFTSANAVRLFMEKIRKEEIDIRALAAVKLATIGSETVVALREYGLYVDWMPEQYTRKSLADLLCLLVGKGRILIPTEKNESKELSDELRANKKNFEEIAIYEEVRPHSRMI